MENGLLPADDALTRSQLLKLRGMELPSANGHSEEQAPEVEGPTTEGPPSRSCRGCGSPLPGDPRQLWCSSACRKRHTRKAQVGPRATGTRPLAPAPLAAAQAELPDLLGALEGLAGQMRPGWRAELVDGRASLSWGP